MKRQRPHKDRRDYELPMAWLKTVEFDMAASIPDGNAARAGLKARPSPKSKNAKHKNKNGKSKRKKNGGR